MNPRVAAALALALTGCPARPTPVVTAPVAHTDARFHVTPALARRASPAGETRFAADGSVTRDGARAATITPTEIRDAQGNALATLSPDGTIRVTGASRSLRVVDDALVRDDGARITREPDGVIALRDREGGVAGSPWRIESLDAPAGAPLVILTLLLLDGLVPAQR